MLTHKLHSTKSRIEFEEMRLNTDKTTASKTPAGRKLANSLKAQANKEIALAKAGSRKFEKRAEECGCFTFSAPRKRSIEVQDVQKE